MSYGCSLSYLICSSRHHALLYQEADSTSKAKSGPAYVTLLGNLSTPVILLGTALVHVRDIKRSYHTVRDFIDSAAQISALTSDSCTRLGLCPSRWTLPVTGLSGQTFLDIKGAVQLQIQLRKIQSQLIATRVWVLVSITSELLARQLPRQIRMKCKHLSLADPEFDTPSPVELFLDVDVFPQV